MNRICTQSQKGQDRRQKSKAKQSKAKQSKAKQSKAKEKKHSKNHSKSPFLFYHMQQGTIRPEIGRGIS